MECFKMLYEHYVKTIYGFCLRMLNNQQDAEDAVQTIFHNLFRNISGFKFKSKFSTYLFSITHNVCFDSINKRKNIIDDLEKAENLSIIIPDVKEDLSMAISKLPERTRECFILFAIEGYPQNEIADLLNIKIGTVKSLIFQARQKLISWLND